MNAASPLESDATTRVGNSAAPDGQAARRVEVLRGVAVASVFFPLLILILATAGFAAGARLGVWVAPVAAVGALLAVRFVTASWRAATLPAGLAVLLHVAAGVVSYFFFDCSWDGQAFHQEAILRLAAGWNPLFEDAASYGTGHELWLNHYAKVTWISGGAVFLTTGHIEISKLFHFTLLAAAGCEVAAALTSLTRLRPLAVALLSLLAALNPVVVYQATTFYLDGPMASVLTIVVTGIIWFLVAARWSLLVLPLAAVGVLVNVKVNALAYAVVLLAFAVLAAWRWHGFRIAWRFAAIAAAAGAFGMLALGYAPYVRNLREKGALFYPYAVTPRLVDTDTQRAVNLADKDRVSRFVLSSFSYSERVRPPGVARLKLPFQMSLLERKNYDPDIEIGGFGPLYGGLFVLGVAGALGLCLSKSAGGAARLMVLIAALVFVSIFVHSETWWARYVPQGWLVPLFIAVGCLLAAQGRWLRRLGWAIVIVAVLNVGFVGLAVARLQTAYTSRVHTTLAEMRAARQPIAVDFDMFQTWRRRLQEAQIAFVPTAPPSAAEQASWHEIACTFGHAGWRESRADEARSP